MLEAGLTDGQRASLMVALAYHEVGHVIHTLGIETAVRKALGDPASPGIDGLRARYGALVFNLVHDLYLEAQQVVNFPGFAPTLRVKESFFGSVWEPVLDTRGHRWDALVSATLYPKGSDWTKDADVSAFFDWATRWAEECRGSKPRTAKGTLALVNEALDILRLEDEPEDEGNDPDKGDEDGRKEQESAPEEEDEEKEGDNTSSPNPEDEPEEEDEEGTGSGGSDDDSDEGEEAPVGTEGTGDDADEGDAADSDESEEADDTSDEEAPPSTARPQVHPYWEPKDIDLSKVQADIDRLEKVSVSGRDRVAVPNGAHKREVRILRVSRR